MDIVKEVADAIDDIPGIPSPEVIARVAIEEYQRAIWSPTFDISRRAARIVPELRRIRAQQLTAMIMNIVGKHLCDHGGKHGHRDASEALMEALYESGAEIITDVDRATAGLPPRGPYGLTEQELQIMEARRTEIMLRPIPPIFVERRS